MDNDELAKALTGLDSTLKEVLKWIRFSSLQDVKKVLIETLVEDEDRLVYELTDGDRSTTDVSKLSGVPARTIARRWQSWTRMGIVEKTEKYGGSRVKRVCSLEDVGIVVPKARRAVQKELNEEAQSEHGGEGAQVESE